MVAARRASSARRHSERQLRGTGTSCGSTLGLADLIRAKRGVDGRVLEEWGIEEPQAAQEFCGRSVSRAKELDQWVTRVREARDQAQRADVRLADSLREARTLQDELRFAKDDLAKLRQDAEQSARERGRWEGQLEASKSCIRKLEARLVALHRLDAEHSMLQARTPPEVERAEQELRELTRQRDRLRREKETLERQGQEHAREVRVLNRALGIQPAVPTDTEGSMAEALRRDLWAAEEQAEAMRLQLVAVGHEAVGLRSSRSTLESELADCCDKAAGAVRQLATLETETAEAHAAGPWLATEAAQARADEAAAREEVAMMQQECAEGAVALHRQQAACAEVAQEVREAQGALLVARRRAFSSEEDGQVRAAELEAQQGALRAELQSQEATRTEQMARHAAAEAESTELRNRAGRLERELEDSAIVEAQMQASLAAAQRNVELQASELRDQEVEARDLAQEAHAGSRREELLRSELSNERWKAQEASQTAAVLMEQRRQVSAEAGEALRRCDGVFTESRTVADGLREREGQLARSERSCELMRDTLGQRLAMVHAQVQEAESAHAQAIVEMREERREHRRLHAQVAHQNTQRRAQLARPGSRRMTAT